MKSMLGRQNAIENVKLDGSFSSTGHIFKQDDS